LKASLKEIERGRDIISLEMAAYIDRLLVQRDFDLTMLSGYQGPDASALSTRVGSQGQMNFMNLMSAQLWMRLCPWCLPPPRPAERAKHYYAAQVIPFPGSAHPAPGGKP
jgi:hypothetical protein